MLAIHRDNESRVSAAGRWPAELRRAAKVLDADEGDRLYQEGEDADGIYFLISGGLKLTRRASDADFILDLVWPGTPFGEDGALAGRRRLTSAHALKPCRLMHVGRAELNNVIRACPAVALDLLERMARRQGAVFERMLELTWPESADRIASAHERLADLVEGSETGTRVRASDVAAHALTSAREVRLHPAFAAGRGPSVAAS